MAAGEAKFDSKDNVSSINQTQMETFQSTACYANTDADAKTTCNAESEPSSKKLRTREGSSGNASTAAAMVVNDSFNYSHFVCPKLDELPPIPPSMVNSNYAHYFVIDFHKPGNDQYIYRHANGLCVIGIAPTHVAFGEGENIVAVDFNVGKGNRSDMKASGKRKKDAHFFEANSALCKIISNDTSYIVRCCVRGSLLEVNERLIKEPELLKKSAGREGYVAIMMPRPEDWAKAQCYLVTEEEYKRRKRLCQSSSLS